jgi:hypothetical protein
VVSGEADGLIVPPIRDVLNTASELAAPALPFGVFAPVHQPGFTELPIGCTPPVKTAAADAEISAGFGDLTGLFGVSQNTKLARNLALFLVHQYLLRPTNVSSLEMSREYRHIYAVGVVPSFWIVAS